MSSPNVTVVFFMGALYFKRTAESHFTEMVLRRDSLPSKHYRGNRSQFDKSMKMRNLTQPGLDSFLKLALIFFLSVIAVAQSRTLYVDASQVTGRIRSFQGVNGPPTPVMEGLPDLVGQYNDLHIDMVRTHDFMGPTEIDTRFVIDDPMLAWLVPNSEQRAKLVVAGNASIIFPDGSADPQKPESYRFGPTDKVIQAIRETNAEVYYRIGRSFGANRNPPADFDKFADIVKHIAMHYNQGWANGFHDNIRYWEFWNEPEFFWSGTPEQFYSLYEKTARALKSVDPSLKVGGDAKALPMDEGPYREGFLNYCAAHKLPLDFYSWHTYADFSADPYDAVRIGKELRSLLDAKGFRNAESILSEWNLSADFTDDEKQVLQGADNAAYVGAVMIYLQDSGIDRAQFYRGDATWMGLFGPDREYFKTAYTFKTMAAMLDTSERLHLTGSDTFGFAALAGRSTDRKTVRVLISNYEIPPDYKPHVMPIPPELQSTFNLDFSKLKFLPPRTGIRYENNSGYTLTVDHLPWGNAAFGIKRFRVTKTQNLALVEEKAGKDGKAQLSNPLPPPGVELIVLQRQ
jgi:xylan 1,4-beta-xylosidase